ncbi:hypothetical protein DFH29DRAFT_1079632 [Suillus ampliporus]|nr:hypothetical protein DFH29DRAFT_1079632 [Suillus ampliporus]
MCFFSSIPSCSKYELLRQVVFFSQAIIVCLVLTTRTYALYGGSKRLLTCMVIILFSLAGGACVRVRIGLRCLLMVSRWELLDITQATRPSCQELAALKHIPQRQPLGLGWHVYRICKTRGLLRLSLVTRRNIVDIIFHDGAMYFGAMALVNIPNILTYYSGSVATRGSLATFSSCMSVTLISRLMLNLHKSVNAGIFSISARDDDGSLPVLTTRVDVQSAISSHHW